MIRSAALVSFLLVAACQRVSDAPAQDESESDTRGQVQRYVFGTTDGEEVSAEGMRGRVTALLFVTTFDLASQLAAKQLNQALRTHAPRFNAAAVVLEAPKYAPLADVFRSSLQLTYPVAIADLGMLVQNSTLGEVHSVPTLIILDPQGREVLRKYGAFSNEELDGWLTRGR
ncbi:MAG TPA: TlpA family protein disulfide reductase [Polyangiaceae bacterium]|nr:TlpA family protein disulfide reductase [Polyangiaceae bacterium]